jgi:phage regulator Rha-like protein
MTSESNSTALVTLVDGEPTTTTLVIAEFTGVQHKNLLGLVRKHQADLEQFGQLAFQTRVRMPGQTGPDAELADLNEQQSALMLTYMRNTERVRELKVKFVAEFFRMRQALKGEISNPTLLDFKSETVVLALTGQIDAKDTQIATTQSQMAELLLQQARLIALLEQRPAAAPAIPAAQPRPGIRFTTAHWLAKSGLRYTSSQKRQIDAAVGADYIAHRERFDCTENGFGLFHPSIIERHAMRILGAQKNLQF